MISYKDIALQILSYSSQADYNCYRVIANFGPNFVGMATGVGHGKMQLAAFDGPSSKIILQAQKSPKKTSYASQVKANFVPNFVPMATGVGREIIQLAAFDGPSPKPPIVAKISQKSFTQAKL